MPYVEACLTSRIVLPLTATVVFDNPGQSTYIQVNAVSSTVTALICGYIGWSL